MVGGDLPPDTVQKKKLIKTRLTFSLITREKLRKIFANSSVLLLQKRG